MTTKIILKYFIICFILLITLNNCNGGGGSSGGTNSGNSSGTTDQNSGGNGNGNNEEDDTLHTATPLKNPSIGVFLDVSLDNINDVRNVSTKAKIKNLTFVNLILCWKELEPEDNHFDFEKLSVLISEIKTNDLQCVLRIYFNAGTSKQAAPDWLFQSGVKYYNDYKNELISYKQPLPWDSEYQAQVDELLDNLSEYFSTSKIYPDAFQVSAGGNYGTQWLSYKLKDSGDFADPDEYLTFLFEAEKWHVRKFDEYFGDDISLILMINKLTENSTLKYSVLDEAFRFNYEWVQTNSCSQRLQSCDYGDDTLDMIKRYCVSGDMFFMLEEEAGKKPYSGDNDCPGMPGEDIGVRVDRIDSIERENDIRVNGIQLIDWTWNHQMSL